MIFDRTTFVEDCKRACAEGEPMLAVREVVERPVSDSTSVERSFGNPDGWRIEVLYNDIDLTVMHFVWPPSVDLFPHEHKMWSTVGIYGGVEDNTHYRRAGSSIEVSGHERGQTGDVLLLGADGIHSVRNPTRQLDCGAARLRQRLLLPSTLAMGSRHRRSEAVRRRERSRRPRRRRCTRPPQRHHPTRSPLTRSPLTRSPLTRSPRGPRHRRWLVARRDDQATPATRILSVRGARLDRIRAVRAFPDPSGWVRSAHVNRETNVRRSLVMGLLMPLFLLAACGDDSSTDDSSDGGGTTTQGGSGEAGQSALSVTAQDISFSPEALTASAGDIEVTMTNDGQIEHTWVVEDHEADLKLSTPQRGATDTGTINLSDGTYTYYCDVAGHRSAGMEGTLTVE